MRSEWKPVTVHVQDEDITGAKKYNDDPVRRAMMRTFEQATNVYIPTNGEAEIRRPKGPRRIVQLPPDVRKRISDFNTFGLMEPFSFKLNLKYPLNAKYYP